MKGKEGKILIFGGLLCLLTAGCLTVHNFREECRVYVGTAATAAALEAAMPPAEKVAETMEAVTMEMPVQTINGQDYIGTLEIPALELKLGVISRWSAERLQIAPCRYGGSAYTGGLVIAGHNYSAHFGRLQQLQPGDTVTMTDAEGREFTYAVELTEILLPEETEAMLEESWDLSLFTCTLGGASRVTVRCRKL